MNQILLLHGALGSSADLEPLKKFLEKDFKVHSLDFPGHGGKEMPSSFSIPFFARYVEDYCRLHSLSGIPVFGYSMGGYVAIYLANQAPHLFTHIITLGTVLYWDESLAAGEAAKLIPSIVEEKLPRFASSLQQMHHPNNWKEVMKNTAEMLQELGKQNLIGKDVLSQLNIPVLLMLGDRDKMVSREKTLEVFGLLEKSQLAILPGTPHPITSCNTLMLEMMIRNFLEI